MVISNQVYESAAIQDPGINNGTRNKAGTQLEYNTELELGPVWNNCCNYIRQTVEKELKVIETRHLEASNTAARPCKGCGQGQPCEKQQEVVSGLLCMR